ncbi:hypothetical protein LCGC14_2495890, partial [marine sediment metagenome]
ADTSVDSPAELAAVMASGIIKQVSVQIPRGSRSLVHTVAWRGQHQLWPSNPDGTHKGDDPRLKWEEDLDLTEPPHTITLKGWSPGTSFPHVVTWRFQVDPVPVREAKKVSLKQGILSAFAKKGAS